MSGEKNLLFMIIKTWLAEFPDWLSRMGKVICSSILKNHYPALAVTASSRSVNVIRKVSGENNQGSDVPDRIICPRIHFSLPAIY